jgi:tetrapyrrole methylase family protein/MazG family protein
METTSAALQRLQELIQTLRSPHGCPWDSSRTREDAGKYLIEEAYEVMDAIAEQSPPALKEELGDLLFQILFLVRMAEESDEFILEDVIVNTTEKMIRRHPHVFGDAKVSSIDDVKCNWEKVKQAVEKKPAAPSRLGKLPRSLPALMSAQEYTKRAAELGFDWPNMESVLKKIEEEIREFRNVAASSRQERIREEIGDLLFSIVNLSRFAGVYAEEALHRATEKFCRRFQRMEEKAAEAGYTSLPSSLDQLDDLWEATKAEEMKGEGTKKS